MVAKNTICLWYDKDAEEAANFYARTFPDSAVSAVHRAPTDFPGGSAGQVLTVEFTVLGVSCLGLNGGPVFKHSEAFSFQIATDDQAETDRYWDAIVGNGGAESACGWCKDKWGLSWQITPRVLTEAMLALMPRHGIAVLPIVKDEVTPEMVAATLQHHDVRLAHLFRKNDPDSDSDWATATLRRFVTDFRLGVEETPEHE